MCLSVPAKVLTVDGDSAMVSIGGSIIAINIQLVDNVETGDYVLVHTGFALEKINETEALETLKMIGLLRTDKDFT
ncbi:MAG: HypC/HybG/HupF family hydrogenase formation chaperone [Bacteroidales bacterium]|nr:HypC/HybG/HupF family hydrogenase formation chaperone [Bacteroidales bacterium]